MADFSTPLPLVLTGLISALGGGSVGAALVAWIKRGGDLKIKEIDANIAHNAQHLEASDKLIQHLEERMGSLASQLQTAQMETKGFEKDWLEAETRCLEKIEAMKEKHEAALTALRDRLEGKIASMEERVNQDRMIQSHLESELRKMTEERDALREVNNNLITRNGELKQEAEALKQGRRKEDLN